MESGKRGSPILNYVSTAIRDHNKATRALRSKFGEINIMVNLGFLALKSGHRIILFGNGGSAADAQHIAGEFVGYPILTLTDAPTFSAAANDFGYEFSFAKQLRHQCREGDLAIGMSTSGNSENVIEGIKEANELGAMTVGLTGGDGGKLIEVAKMSIVVPSKSVARIQECHMLIGHIFAEVVQARLK